VELPQLFQLLELLKVFMAPGKLVMESLDRLQIRFVLVYLEFNMAALLISMAGINGLSNAN
jgi:hypothetical protein